MLTDFIVGLSQVSYTVEEGSSVEVCAVLGNQTEVDLQSEVEVIITTMSDGSAEGKSLELKPKLDWIEGILLFPAGRDFSALVQMLSLTSDSLELCVELNASSDMALEGEETFSVLLSSPNYTHAIIIPNQATVAITDLSGLNHSWREYYTELYISLCCVSSCVANPGEVRVPCD